MLLSNWSAAKQRLCQIVCGTAFNIQLQGAGIPPDYACFCLGEKAGHCTKTEEVNAAADSDSDTIAVMFSTSESSPERVAKTFVPVSTDDHQQSGNQQEAPGCDDETESADGSSSDHSR